jgi:hypothetical protein
MTQIIPIDAEVAATNRLAGQLGWNPVEAPIAIGVSRSEDPLSLKHDICIIGVDIALVADRTAIAEIELPIARGEPMRMPRAIRLPTGTTLTLQSEQVAEIVLAARGRGLRCVVVVDITGAGGAVLPDITKAIRSLATVVPVVINGANKAVQREGTWFVPKQDLVTTTQLVLEQRRLDIGRFADRDLLVNELAEFKMTASDNGRDEYGNDVRQNPHDDLVLATALALWFAAHLNTVGPVGIFGPPRRPGAPRIDWFGNKR